MGANRARTVEATDRLIRRFKDQGYEFVTVEEMAGAKGRSRAPVGG
jgi:peptidoglycan/xylan/chitin deacetylase (PgdA/CDA1 family)